MIIAGFPKIKNPKPLFYNKMFIKMNHETLRKLQLLEFKILLEFKRICDKYNIEYFLSGGTLLGAVRHQGFIPWDDDIDVGLRRSEYEKFLKIAPKELGPEYFLQTSKTDSEYFSAFAKIRLIGTEYIDSAIGDWVEHNEIWIDVFPFDNIPDNKLRRKIHDICLFSTEIMCISNVGYTAQKSKSIINRFRDIICLRVGKILSKKTCVSLFEWALQKPNKHPSLLIHNWPFKPRNARAIDSFSTLSFEGTLFPVPSRYHEYLTEEYGDYMKFPPENERMCHGLYEPKFGKYANVREK